MSTILANLKEQLFKTIQETRGKKPSILKTFSDYFAYKSIYQEVTHAVKGTVGPILYDAEPFPGGAEHLLSGG